MSRGRREHSWPLGTGGREEGTGGRRAGLLCPKVGAGLRRGIPGRVPSTGLPVTLLLGLPPHPLVLGLTQHTPPVRTPVTSWLGPLPAEPAFGRKEAPPQAPNPEQGGTAAFLKSQGPGSEARTGVSGGRSQGWERRGREERQADTQTRRLTGGEVGCWREWAPIGWACHLPPLSLNVPSCKTGGWALQAWAFPGRLQRSGSWGRTGRLLRTWWGPPRGRARSVLLIPWLGPSRAGCPEG